MNFQTFSKAVKTVSNDKIVRFIDQITAIKSFIDNLSDADGSDVDNYIHLMKVFLLVITFYHKYLTSHLCF